MAKISANGCTELGRETAEVFIPTIGNVTYTFVHRSDGVILRKSSFSNSPYTKVARIASGAADPGATFRAYVKRFRGARGQ